MDIREKLQQDFSNLYIKKCNRGEKKWIMHISQRFGKIKLSINILDKIDIHNPRILISYPDNKIQTSWLNDFDKFFYVNPNITFVNTASIEKYTEEQYDVYIFDECNDVSPRQLTAIEKIVARTEYVIGLSGTISRESEQTLSEIGLNILVKYPVEQAIADGIISDYNIEVYRVPLDNVIKTTDKSGKLITEKKRFDNYSYVIENLKQQKKDFMFLALQRNRILQSSISKQNKLRDILKRLSDKRVLVFTGLAKIADNLGIPSFHSKTKDKAAFTDFLEGRINHLALAEIGKSGITYPALDYVILSSFTYNSEVTSQVLSRAMVLDYKTKTAQIIIVTSNEEVELKKLRETLKDFDESKIKYV